MVEQNAQMLSQAQQQQQPPSPDQEAEQNKYEEVRQAIMFVNQMKQKGVNNRSIQEQSKYKQAVQIIAKNPDIASQFNNMGEQKAQPQQQVQ